MMRPHLSMFGGHWASTSGNIEYLTCHLTLQNHLTGGSSNFTYEWELFKVYHHLAKFGGHRRCSSRNIFLVYHVIKQDHIIKGSGDYNDRGPQGNPTSVTILPSLVTIGTLYWRYISFILSRDFTRPRYQSIIWLSGLEPLKISHHLTKFGGHRHCGSGDIVLFCHAISQDHGIKQSYDFIDRSPSKQVTILQFGFCSYSGSGVVMILVSHVVSQGHLIKGSCDFMSGSTSCSVITLPSLVALGIVVVEMWRLLWLKGKISYTLV